jgi:hypothetical protein
MGSFLKLDKDQSERKYWRQFTFMIRHQHFNCAIAASQGAYAPVTELHHKLANSRVNRSRFPLLIDSLFNLVAVNHGYHMANGSFQRMSVLEACKREAFLERHPLAARRLNGGLLDVRMFE